MKKVLIITYYWPPSGGAGVQRWLKFVKFLPGFGFSPYVLTVDPSYAAYPVRDSSLEKEVPGQAVVIGTRTKEPFEWYKKISRNKEIPYSGFANQKNPGLKDKFFRMIRGNFFIPDARKGWNRYALKEARKIISKEQIKAVITSGPPHSTHLIGLKLKNTMSISWIADFRDPWTDIFYYDKLYPSLPAKMLDKKYERSVIKTADKIVVISNHMKKMIANKTRPSRVKKINVIPNGFDKEDFNISFMNPADKFIITYTGTLSEEYDTDGFLQTLADVVKEHRMPITLQFVGVVSPRVKKNIEKYGLDKTTIYTHHVSHQEAISYMMKTTILFLAIPNKPGNKGILSGKLFEYLASGKPIFGIGPVDGDAASIITECDGGKMFDYKDLKGMKTYLLESIEHWKKDPEQLNKTNLVYEKYSRKNLTKQLSGLLEPFY